MSFGDNVKEYPLQVSSQFTNSTTEMGLAVSEVEVFTPSEIEGFTVSEVEVFTPSEIEVQI